ncbi:hypothetical protein ACRQ5B_11060 [Pseudarthrobacter sp. L19]|uniref:hypothetical protein n=1 Tax=Pseudarthrobacter sp. L19 TaxID=3423951 RepID=UPI003D7B1BE9
MLDRPELDTAPRGTGVLVAPQSPGIQAKALTHATAKWAWLDESTAPGLHVLRLSYGRGATTGAPESAPAGARPEPDTEADLLEAALRDASTLLGVGLSRDDLVGWDVVRWAGALPFASLGHKQRVARVRELCAAEGDLAVVGGWVAGNGLAAIVADTPARSPRCCTPTPGIPHPEPGPAASRGGSGRASASGKITVRQIFPAH